MDLRSICILVKIKNKEKRWPGCLSGYNYLDVKLKDHKRVNLYSILVEFKYIAVYGCWPFYWKCLDSNHTICWVDLLRE